ncbi:hypothetical protein BGZ52_010315, partial [Haplosporangium bisporale]
MATQAPNPSDVSNLPKDQQLNVHEDNVLTGLDVSARPVVPPHLLARLSQHDSPDLTQQDLDTKQADAEERRK